MAWTPITDLPDNWQEFVSTEVAALAETWARTYLSLKEKALVDQFSQIPSAKAAGLVLAPPA